jgi:outer membrane immunogenic protein
MRKAAIGIVAIATVIGAPAIAADLAVKAPPPPPPAPTYSWTGFYLNAGGGYGLWQADSQLLSATGACLACTTESLGGKGFLGTVGGGFDWQLGAVNIGPWSPQVVAGVLADYDFESLKGSIPNAMFFESGTLRQTGSWAAGARVGLVWPADTFSYINAGVTRTRFGASNFFFDLPPIPTATTTPAFTKTGWFLGGGTETSLSPILPAGFFLRSEYRYSYFGTANVPNSLLAFVPPAVDIITVHPTDQTLTTSLVYKFNWTGSGAAPASSVPAQALVYKARPATAPGYSWSGLYLNAGGGYGMWQADSEVFDTASGACLACVNQSLAGKGFLGTVGGGFDYQLGALNIGQWNPQVVAGLLADYDFESLKGTLEDPGNFETGPIKETGSWAAGARIGLVWTPQMFSYVNGGATGTRFGGTTMLSNFTGAPAAGVTAAFTKTGWFLGGGAETSLSPMLPAGFFLRSEYRYSYFGTSNVPEFIFGTPLEFISFHPTVQTLTTSLVYKFNWLAH